MNNEDLEKLKEENRELAMGKAARDLSINEAISVYRQTVSGAKTTEERIKRINAFRSGW